MVDEVAKACLKELNVLYVEDNAETQDEIAFFLKKRVKNLFIASNGLDGLQYFDANKIDIIVSDIQMLISTALRWHKRSKRVHQNFPSSLSLLLMTPFIFKKLKRSVF